MPLSAICRITGKPFEILGQEIEFCKKFAVPLPEISPEERIRALMATRNERKLHHRKCDATGENIISAYPQDVPFPVYKNSVWWGGDWDGRSYGREFDFSRPFFEQFGELQKVVPREGTSIFNSENCEYNSHVRSSKNCYMNSLAVGGENVYYSYWMLHDTDVMDSMFTHESTLCYECSEVNESYHCVFLQESVNCNDAFFSYQLRGCNHCIFCTNLQNKSYYACNEPCTKEEFEALRKKTLNGSYANWKKATQEFLKIRTGTVHRALHNLNCENVKGDHLYNSRNLENCFDGSGNEDCIHAISLGDSKNIQSCYSVGWPSSEVIYSSAVIRGCNDIAFGTYLWFSNGLRYCDSCVSCHDCFGCIGLQHKEYCLLNRQYSKEEYLALVPKIAAHMVKTGEWGRFFPPELSAFDYNQTSAAEYFPISKEEALRRGYRWREEDEKEYLSQKYVIPENIADVPDAIETEILACEVTGKNYRIIPQELEFYRKMRLPIPRLHPDTRHRQRLALRNPWKIWERNCARCSREMLTTYAPERPETVYCEECYLQTIS